MKKWIVIIAVCTVSLFGFMWVSLPLADARSVVKELLASADVQIDGKRPWDIQVHNDAFYNRVISEGSLGLGESYMDGWWDCQALDECLFRLCRAHVDANIAPTWTMRWMALKAYLFNMQDKWLSRRVIDAHYQLGNDLYTSMLDPLLIYSCGYWKEAGTLAAAQEAKCDLICRKLGLAPGMKILDIGCGWGGFVKYAAANYGVSAVGVTLSENQAEYARQACQGLPVEIQVKDYRDIEGSFDRVISIGMFEHVGAKNFNTFMQVVDRALQPHGLALLHTIGSNVSTNVTDPWIDAYIFPNGQLPSIAQIGAAIEGRFIMEDWHNFGAFYDPTLIAWHQNFQANWHKLHPQYGERFFRMWNYYLLSCAAAFRARSIQLWQLVLSKDGVVDGYDSIR